MGHLRSFRRFWSFTAIVVMMQMIVVNAMASSGDLHKHFHCHSDDPSHECAVTLMLQGGYSDEVPDAISVDFIPEMPPVAVGFGKAIEKEPSHLAGGVLAHAPPRGP